jgi:hypothetical protein
VTVDLPELAEYALLWKRAHEWGYRFVWPPTAESLTPYQVQLIWLAEQAEAYVQHRHQQASRRGASGQGDLQGTVTDRHFDTARSRSDWASQFDD